jgi:hypothetical protein
VAAHGDFACTAAMQLAKPLKQKWEVWPKASMMTAPPVLAAVRMQNSSARALLLSLSLSSSMNDGTSRQGIAE